MRRILEKLWASAKERAASLPDAPRQLAQARASLGMPSVGDPADADDVRGAPGAGAGAGPRSGRQGSRGMREELSNSKRRHQRQQQQQQSSGGSRAEDGAVDGPAGARGEDTVALGTRSNSTSSEQLEQHDQQEGQSQFSSSHFLDTYVFLEEFLKELFCALSAKNGVETDALGLSESHRHGPAELLRTQLLAPDGDSSPKQASGAGPGDGGGDRGFGTGAAAEGDGGEKEEEGELPTSLDEFLREAAFPTFASPPLSY